jgi:hypothetical protein
MQILPVLARDGSPNVRLGVTLDFGVPYVFDLRWNSRDASWYMDVLEADETPIVSGVRLVLGTYLGRRTRHQLFKRGVFVMFDTSGSGLDATLDDFGKRVQLRRYLAQEIIQGRRGYL